VPLAILRDYGLAWLLAYHTLVFYVLMLPGLWILYLSYTYNSWLLWMLAYIQNPFSTLIITGWKRLPLDKFLTLIFIIVFTTMIGDLLPVVSAQSEIFVVVTTFDWLLPWICLCMGIFYVIIF